MTKRTGSGISKLWGLLVLVSAMGLVSCDNPILAKVQAAVKSASIPVISPQGGTHKNSCAITLSCSDTKAAIYYTTDGSDPTTSTAAVAYSAPINLNYGCTLKSATKSDHGWSSISEAAFSFTYEGVLDPAFNPKQHSGVAKVSSQGDYRFWTWYSAALQSDGKIVAIGSACKANPSDPEYDYTYICVARFTGSGELDTAFGNNGYVIFEDDNYRYSEGRSIAVDSKDRIYVQGYVTDDKTWESGPVHGIVGRLLPDGAIDTNYGQNGGYQTPVTDGIAAFPYYVSRSLAIDPSTGESFFTLGSTLYKLDASGQLDTGFGASIGKSGSISTQYLDGLMAGGTGDLLGLRDIYSIVRTNEGHILATMYKSGSSLIVADTTSNGEPSNWYIEPPSFGGLVGKKPSDVASFSDGSILILARGILNENRNPVDAAYTLWKFDSTHSSPLEGWGQTADSGTILDYDDYNATPYSVAVLMDGSFAVGGRTIADSGDDAPRYWTLARLSSKGAVLSYTVDRTNFETGTIRFILPLSDGKFLAVGSSNGGATIARYWP
mgnify:CR=1 FL=1